MGTTKIVDEINETTMQGDTLLERRINAYLTKQFIWPREMPDDECLDEARTLIAFVLDTLRDRTAAGYGHYVVCNARPSSRWGSDMCICPRLANEQIISLRNRNEELEQSV